ncbi:MAG: lysine 2,3-aminomutase [Deltaproteobacteria bacterium RBG_13_47_9]|nr:MAG: lysine 2,3-aminomutase [Deltaproteobacteria bacterium RBG_13_47_9]
MTTLKELTDRFSIDPEPLKPVVEHYPLRITSYYFSLIREMGDPIWRQCIPDVRELEQDHLSLDPLGEEELSPVSNLLHRYPDRAVLLVSSSCPTLCRFCTRKNRITNGKRIPMKDSLDAGIKYLERSSMIREVILSGGDPLLLSDDELDDILMKLRGIPHLQMVRINTRIPVTFPERITSRLCRILKQHHPLYVNTHFNHPLEITPESSVACAKLADAGIPMGNQTVLLKEVNDDPEVMKELMKKLLTLRVRPYYIHQMDRVKGTNHFRTSVGQGKKIMSRLRGHISGMAIPYYVIDLPGGKGKVPILPDDVRREGKTLFLRNYLGEWVEYPDDGGED